MRETSKNKWHSTAAELESDVVEDGKWTYANETLRTKPSDTTIGWNKKIRHFAVALPKQKIEVTKRIVFQTITVAAHCESNLP